MTATDTQWIESARTLLRESGRRSGGARAEVFEQISRERCAVSADQLANALSTRGRRVGRASLYRALEALEEIQLVQRVEFGDGNARWERVGGGGGHDHHHHHLVCRSCGTVVPFSDDKLERALSDLSNSSAFTVDSHDVTLHGLCESCSPGA